MKRIKNTKGIETLIFAETLEDEALDQIKKMCNFEAYLNSRIRIMPDVHVGKGCTIGTTMTVSDKVTPNLVGVDIGCGMLTIRLRNRDIDLRKLDCVIHEKVPCGSSIHKRPTSRFDFSDLRCQYHVDLNRASLSIGSLGGGNHFIEVGKAETGGDVYLVIHSGSRNLGAGVCRYYQDRAISFMMDKSAEMAEHTRTMRQTSVDKDLAYLTGKGFLDYIHDMEIVQRYAVQNRNTIAQIILSEMSLSEEYRFETVHNYIDFKRMILRKGAVSAEKGETLLIPINMRDGSLLCVGKGNPDWNYSAPHGAGRLMSRTKAKCAIDMSDFEDSMKGIYTSSVGRSTLDEAPQAYKSMKEIRSAIVDTVVVTDVIRPFYNFKAP